VTTLPKVDEYERLITDNPIFGGGRGVGTYEDAINWGPLAPCYGFCVNWDLRKVDHYECYDDFDWQVHWETAGDCFVVVRIREMRESVKILRRYKGTSRRSLREPGSLRMAEGPKSEWNGFDYQYW